MSDRNLFSVMDRGPRFVYGATDIILGISTYIQSLSVKWKLFENNRVSTLLRGSYYEEV